MYIAEIRKRNLLNLIANLGKQRVLADKTGLAPTYISQMVNGTRKIGDSTAKKIELSLSLKPGWMDRTHSNIDGKINEQSVEDTYPAHGKFTSNESEAFRLGLQGIEIFENEFDVRMDLDDKHILFESLVNLYLKNISRGDAPPNEDEILADIYNLENYRKARG